MRLCATRTMRVALLLWLLCAASTSVMPSADNLQSVANYRGGGEAAGPIYQYYTVRYGDTLAGIAYHFGVDLDTLMRVNGLRNANVIYVGQRLRVPVSSKPAPAAIQPIRDGPNDKLVPDSEAIYSPSYATFNVAAVAQHNQGYLASYREEVDGEMLSGAQIIQLVAERFSVGPRVLLTVLEMESGWVTGRPATRAQQDYPMSITDRFHTGLYFQMQHAADTLNAGYYSKLLGRTDVMALADGSRVRFAAGINPGTAAVQNLLARATGYENWLTMVGANGFKATYQKLFGDPFANAIEPLVPLDVKQPALRLPFEDDHTWFYTGGPHGAWADGSAWAAVDFAPLGPGGCVPSREWAIAVAPGRVAQSEHGRVMLNLDFADFQGSGWTVMYMHVHPSGRMAKGTTVNTGDPIGHPSCEGGFATATHLHIARMYNGQWMSVASQAPFVISGWQVQNAVVEYDGTLVRDGESRRAINGHVRQLNGITADGRPPVNTCANARCAGDS